jgi:DNA-binding Lrp family transcriptional regulator
MAQSNSNIRTDILRLTVPEAAQALGISPEAVRNRLSRGTLESAKEDGTVYVLLEADRVRHTANASHDIPGETGAVISAKDETIRVLRDQLEAEREASAELRRIVAGLVQRVPELEAPSETRASSPEAASERGARGDASESSQEPTQRRSWLLRWFGF